ncbi:MAG TPA: FAD-dependent oxidoreductase, partial [Rhodobacteraceae bacterium]|nr:FAD-dependent oxidoreductase [Paracoccaceae bacterium]
LGSVDIARNQPFQKNRRYLFERSKETLGLLYADHYPYRQKATARGVRRAPFHALFKERGAVMSEVAGWERPGWFATPGQAPEYDYAWGRTRWFANVAREHRAIREGVGLYDMTSFGKIRVEGPDAMRFLNHVCGNDVDVATGRIVYTQFLNRSGGIEADVTVTRLAETAYLVVTPSATLAADQAWLRRHLGEWRVVLTDMTAAEGVLAVMGPKARALLGDVSPDDFDAPFGSAFEIEIGMGLARAHRVSYVGELGWEIYVSSDIAMHVAEVLLEAGEAHGLKLCGAHAMDSCRIEKAFRHFGHDITSEDHVLEAGLGFAVKTGKSEFIGRDAVLAKRDAGVDKRLVQFRLKEPEPMLYHNEPILRDGEVVGYLTSGAYGHYLGAAIGLGYVPCSGESAAEVLSSRYQIDVAGTRVEAEASLKPLYDPQARRVRA